MLYAMNIQLYQILSGYAVSEHQLLQSHFKVEATCASESLCSNTAETRHHKMITYINIYQHILTIQDAVICAPERECSHDGHAWGGVGGEMSMLFASARMLDATECHRYEEGAGWGECQRSFD